MHAHEARDERLSLLHSSVTSIHEVPSAESTVRNTISSSLFVAVAVVLRTRRRTCVHKWKNRKRRQPCTHTGSQFGIQIVFARFSVGELVRDTRIFVMVNSCIERQAIFGRLEVRFRRHFIHCKLWNDKCESIFDAHFTGGEIVVISMNSLTHSYGHRCSNSRQFIEFCI